MVVDFSCESGAALLERRWQYSTSQLREVCFARPVFARRVDQRIECGRAGWRDACPHDLVHDVDRFAELLGWLGDLKRRPPACARASVRHQIKHSLRCVGERSATACAQPVRTVSSSTSSAGGTGGSICSGGDPEVAVAAWI